MKEIRRNPITGLLLAGCLAVLAAPAIADRGECASMEGWGRFHEQRAERMQQHQKQLHDALKLTPDQEGAWTKFTESMQPPAKSDRGSEDWSKLTTPERADKMLEFSKKRQERMTEHVAALKTFYTVLTPEQKKTFDEYHAGPRNGRHGPRRPDANPKPGTPGPAKG